MTRRSRCGGPACGLVPLGLHFAVVRSLDMLEIGETPKNARTETDGGGGKRGSATHEIQVVSRTEIVLLEG
jgi:hypothetical protein